MVVGITMVKVLHGNEDEIHLILSNTNGVKEVYRILGEYSLFVIFQAENNLLLHLFIDEVRKISIVTAVWHLLISYEDDSLNREVDLEANRLDISECSQGKILVPGSDHA